MVNAQISISFLKPSLLLHAFQQNWEKKTAFFFFLIERAFSPASFSSTFSFSFSAFLSGCWRRDWALKLLACMGRRWAPALSRDWLCGLLCRRDPSVAWLLAHTDSPSGQNEVGSHLLPLWLWLEPRLGCSYGPSPRIS